MSCSVNLKLLIDETTNRVVFAEVGKETMDFLFGLLTLPVGTVVRLLSNQRMAVGSLGNLYGSIKSLNDQGLLPDANKQLLLKPNAPSPYTHREGDEIHLSWETDSCMRSEFYICNNKDECTMFYNYVTDDSRASCPSCGCGMQTEVQFVGDLRSKGCGYVKGITYMLMDDMVVKPMSTISSIALLKDVEALQEKVVYLDINMGMKLLKKASRSKEVLTSIFLRQEDPTLKDA